MKFVYTLLVLLLCILLTACSPKSGKDTDKTSSGNSSVFSENISSSESAADKAQNSSDVSGDNTSSDNFESDGRRSATDIVVSDENEKSEADVPVYVGVDRPGKDIDGKSYDYDTGVPETSANSKKISVTVPSTAYSGKQKTAAPDINGGTSGYDSGIWGGNITIGGETDGGTQNTPQLPDGNSSINYEKAENWGNYVNGF